LKRYDEAKREGKLKTVSELKEAIVHGAVKRIRPKIMTVMAASRPFHIVCYGASCLSGDISFVEKENCRQSVNLQFFI